MELQVCSALSGLVCWCLLQRLTRPQDILAWSMKRCQMHRMCSFYKRIYRVLAYAGRIPQSAWAGDQAPQATAQETATPGCGASSTVCVGFRSRGFIATRGWSRLFSKMSCRSWPRWCEQNLSPCYAAGARDALREGISFVAQDIRQELPAGSFHWQINAVESTDSFNITGQSAPSQSGMGGCR